jgi:hypothetical protein
VRFELPLPSMESVNISHSSHCFLQGEPFNDIASVNILLVLEPELLGRAVGSTHGGLERRATQKAIMQNGWIWSLL